MLKGDRAAPVYTKDRFLGNWEGNKRDLEGSLQGEG